MWVCLKGLFPSRGVGGLLLLVMLNSKTPKAVEALLGFDIAAPACLGPDRSSHPEPCILAAPVGAGPTGVSYGGPNMVEAKDVSHYIQLEAPNYEETSHNRSCDCYQASFEGYVRIGIRSRLLASQGAGIAGLLFSHGRFT